MLILTLPVCGKKGKRDFSKFYLDPASRPLIILNS